MRCIQDTTGQLTVVEWHGVAPDHAFLHLDGVVSRRLHIAAGGSRPCCGAQTELVALQTDDRTLPAATRAALAVLAPGSAVASTDLAEVAGGWIAAPGVNIRVRAVADLGGPVIAISYDDAAALLAADHDGRLVVRTVAVLACPPEREWPGWRVVIAGVDAVPLHTSLATGHRAGCAA
ncbi:hypothetical protein [Mycolicibacterium aichiense]|uniref:Uncharacterized protein n=1 Tax=Mycolicibacterium aichiense TaxID=1799 RepID=A0AAD1HSX8_9MYCO|nr:hypothetical protein [Mycolicibacterium aichiense]MCV7017018.1 hypothetical protein [Mycolicibacterium aichiense]BBX10555.1 hypothetical protein MAIC_53580 [Mycolicibacterium aichiense]STZ25787.1 Uncharacterised protein [Mycolicibacterium aichiense]